MTDGSLASEPAAGDGRRQSDAMRIGVVLQAYYPDARRALITVSVLSFVAGLLEASALVIITSSAVALTTGEDRLGLGPLEAEVSVALVFAGAMVLLSSLLSLQLSRLIARTTARGALAARSQLLRGFEATSFQRKSEQRLADLQEALTTYVDRLTTASTSLGLALSASLSLISFGFASVVVNPPAAFALVVLGGLVAAVLRPLARVTRAAARTQSATRRRYAQGATEAVVMAREMTVFGVTDRAIDRLVELDEEVARSYERMRFLASFTPRLYQSTALLLVIVAISALRSVEELDISAIGAVVLLLVRSLSYGQQLLATLQSISEHRPYVDRLVALEDDYMAEQRASGLTHVDRFDRLSFDAVDFRYGSGPLVLRDVSVTISAGETVGVIGPSGAGKSTFVNLLLRLYEPTGGSITIDHLDIADVTDSAWHSLCALVPQEPRLAFGTIQHNISFYRDIEEEQIERSATQANASSFVETLPDRYKSNVGELGHGYSGGQRQRLCIARALAASPGLLVLDEPTSALDGESEAAIQTTLTQLRGRVTMVLVAHRLSTLSICDRLLVFEDGRITASGTPTELALSSRYYQDAVRRASESDSDD